MAKTSLVQRLMEWPFRGRQLRAMQRRQSYSRSDFCEHFVAMGVSPRVVDEVWNVLCEHAIDGFKPKAEDDLLRVFGLAEEDLDEDVVLRLLKSLGCRIPTAEEMETLKPVSTVHDLVMFVSSLMANAKERP